MTLGVEGRGREQGGIVGGGLGVRLWVGVGARTWGGGYLGLIAKEAMPDFHPDGNTWVRIRVRTIFERGSN